MFVIYTVGRTSGNVLATCNNTTLHCSMASGAFLRPSAWFKSARLQHFCRSLSSMEDANLVNNCSSTSRQRSSAGIIVIGDEILKGQVQDTNSHFIAKHLHSLGVRVNKISVVPDAVAVIADEVRHFSATFDFVITSGGIGPTHDDLTFEGVAAAFGDQVALRPQLQAFVQQYFKTEDTSQPCFKLARVPTSANLIYAEDRERGFKARFPVVKVRNVYVLPGVPSLLEKAFVLLSKEHFAPVGAGFHCDTVYLSLDEVSVASALNQTVSQCPGVTFGSYPVLYHSYYKTRITLEAETASELSDGRARLLNELPAHASVLYNPDPVSDAWPALLTLTDNQPPVQQAVGVLQECLQRYSSDELCVCFNGGKDCTAVLHLLHALLQHQQTSDRLRAVYIREPKPFPAMERFVDETRIRYDLDLFTIAGPMKEGLVAMKAHWPRVKACVMGTRKDDPYTNHMTAFQPTDGDWPELMRVNPILSWEYDHLWGFVRGLSLPYCPLYDKGYTSLGSVDNTLPNPALQEVAEDGTVSYRPAYQLHDGTHERDGRL